MQRRLSILLSAAGFVAACAALAYLLVAPAYASMSTTTSTSGAAAPPAFATRTLAQMLGARALALPVCLTLLAGVPLVLERTRPAARKPAAWAAGLLLLGFAAMAGFSIGLFFLPAALLVLASAAAPVGARPEPERRP